jgi:hypothetical protein
MSQAVFGGHEWMAERQLLGGRTMSQGIFGVVAIILGIVGLAIQAAHPDVPTYLDAIAAIALGVGLVTVGIALTAGYARLAARVEGASVAGGQMMGTTVDMFLGFAVIVLGILALLRIVPAVLVPVQAILIGVGLMFNSAASVRLATLEADVAGERTVARRIGEELVLASAGVRAIAGVAVVILGIVAIVGTYPLILTLAAAIVAGAAMLVNGTTLSSRMMGVLLPRTT